MVAVLDAVLDGIHQRLHEERPPATLGQRVLGQVDGGVVGQVGAGVDDARLDDALLPGQAHLHAAVGHMGAAVFDGVVETLDGGEFQRGPMRRVQPEAQAVPPQFLHGHAHGLQFRADLAFRVFRIDHRIAPCVPFGWDHAIFHKFFQSRRVTVGSTACT